MWPSDIPTGAHFRGLVYNEPGDAVVSEFSCQIDGDRWEEQLFLRRAGSDIYEPVSSGQEKLTFREPVSCSAVPIVLFSVWRKTEHVGYDWDSIRALNVVSGVVEVLVDENSFPVGQEFLRSWPSSLVSAKPHGEGIICSVGFERATGDKPIAIFVDYWLCELDFRSRHVTRLRELKNVFV